MTGPRIPQTDPRAGYLAHRTDIDQAIERVLQGGRYILGPELAAFEREFADYLGVQHGIGVANGTDAIELALRALGVRPGDRVMTVSFTAAATVTAIMRCGAEPAFVDIDPISFTMSPQNLEDSLRQCHSSSEGGASRRPRVIVPVHLYGQMADMASVLEIASRYGCTVLEDCAQAHGASFDGRKAGAWGTMAAFSFYPTKNLGAFGDGGMIVTHDEQLAQRCRLLREYGWNDQRSSLCAGQNSRLDELQAAILRVKLHCLDSDNNARIQLATTYDSLLDPRVVRLPVVRPAAIHVYHQYAVRHPNRDALRARLLDQSIETSVHYPRAAHQQPAYAAYAEARCSLTETERAAAEVLSLPMYPQLSVESVRRIADAANA